MANKPQPTDHDIDDLQEKVCAFLFCSIRMPWITYNNKLQYVTSNIISTGKAVGSANDQYGWKWCWLPPGHNHHAVHAYFSISRPYHDQNAWIIEKPQRSRYFGFKHIIMSTINRNNEREKKNKIDMWNILPIL